MPTRSFLTAEFESRFTSDKGARFVETFDRLIADQDMLRYPRFAKQTTKDKQPQSGAEGCTSKRAANYIYTQFKAAKVAEYEYHSATSWDQMPPVSECGAVTFRLKEIFLKRAYGSRIHVRPMAPYPARALAIQPSHKCVSAMSSPTDLLSDARQG